LGNKVRKLAVSIYREMRRLGVLWEIIPIIVREDKGNDLVHRA